MIPFKIEVGETVGGIALVSLSGRLNAVSAPEAKDRLKALLREVSRDLIIDLAELTFIDSSGLAALVAAYKASVEVGGNLKLARVVPQVAQVFSLTRLDRVFEIFPDVAMARKSFPGGLGSS
jgi:anti-sigma B factor antagonist